MLTFFNHKHLVTALLLVTLLSSGFCRGVSSRRIEFSGLEWEVKSRFRRPGPNHWTDHPKDVWVDSQGHLHLRIVYRNDRWMCSEVSTVESFGYGRYHFFVSSNLSGYAPSVVAAFFLYENDQKELDMEYTRWGNRRKNGGWFSVQPAYLPEHQTEFSVPKNIDYSTHVIDWQPASVTFEAYHGHYDICPSPSYMIHSWKYESPGIPAPSEERLHINFWLYDQQPPEDDQEAELIINRVEIPDYIHILNRPPVFLGCHDHEQIVKIHSNTSWQVKSSAPWIHVSPVQGSLNDSLIVHVDKNTDREQREGYILIYGSGRHAKYEFIQNDR